MLTTEPLLPSRVVAANCTNRIKPVCFECDLNAPRLWAETFLQSIACPIAERGLYLL